MNTVINGGKAEALSISALVEQCQQEIQAYRCGEASNGAYGLELFHRAIIQGDQMAWQGLLQCLSEVVRVWLRCHPSRAAACRWESEENYVVLAFERFWQATSRQRLAFESFAGALTYLRACLNGVVLDTLRAYSRPKEMPLPETEESEEPYREDQADSNELWEVLQTMLSNEREQRLAYLLYFCGLKPREIVRFCPQEWSDIQEVYRLRRNIVDRLLHNAEQLRWRLDR